MLELPAARCVGLRKTFGSTVAVDGVDLALDQGHFLALLGPSGCGKTTVLRMIAGFEEPDAGTITVAEHTVVGRGLFVPAERRRIGMVFQDYALFPHLDVAGNVGFGLSNDGQSARRVGEVLELVGLAGLERRLPHELSGGQQQRVALARALAPKPDLILLDEPFSNLDAALRVRVRGEVRTILAEAGTAAIFVTHDQAEALSLADQVAVMWAGRIEQMGTPEEVYCHPASRNVATFVGNMDRLPGRAANGRVACELGEFPARGDATGSVDVFIHPEAFQVDPQADGDAEIVVREFFGHDQQVTVRLASGRIIHAQLGAAGAFHRGQRGRVTARGPVSVFPALHPDGTDGAAGDTPPGGGQPSNLL